MIATLTNLLSQHPLDASAAIGYAVAVTFAAAAVRLARQILGGVR